MRLFFMIIPFACLLVPYRSLASYCWLAYGRYHSSQLVLELFRSGLNADALLRCRSGHASTLGPPQLPLQHSSQRKRSNKR